jgi:hypothetical protein
MTYPGAVRVGHDPEDVLAKLRRNLTEWSFPNLMIFSGGGGIENCAGVPSTINEMLLQSHEGVMRLFPVWPRNRDASFGRLRTVGAVLVSAELRQGEVTSLVIESEKGRECVLQNPWPGRAVRLSRNGRPSETLTGNPLRIRTAAGERLAITPEDGAR